SIVRPEGETHLPFLVASNRLYRLPGAIMAAGGDTLSPRCFVADSYLRSEKEESHERREH
ncbi:MAG: hypothetical protein WA938_07980, partial [Candidatus Dormiibacterota bacterium]